MPTPVAECRANANFIQAGQGAWPLPTGLNGRLTNLPLYVLNYATLIARVNNLAAVIAGIAPDSPSRRSNHNDDLGNLPFAPHPSNPVAEFHVGANGLPHPGHLRVVYDAYRRMVFVTPCHYDAWTDAADDDRNPFYIVNNAPLLNHMSFK